MPDNLEITVGAPQPLGLSFQGSRANFSLFSSKASKVTLGLFRGDNPIKKISMNQTGEIWHVGIEHLPVGLEYAYQCELGSPEANPWLMDPYAKIIANSRAKAAIAEPFDWQRDAPPQIPRSGFYGCG